MFETNRDDILASITTSPLHIFQAVDEENRDRITWK